jgi:hypothetical protein
MFDDDSKDDFKGCSDYVNDISKNFNICMHSSCEKEHNPWKLVE